MHVVLQSRSVMGAAVFTAAVLIASSAVTLLVGLPVDGGNVAGMLVSVLVLTALGPVLFAWAWGPCAMEPIWIALAWGLPALAIAAFWYGFVRRKVLAWLLAAAVVWAGFGGFAAWVAVTGSV